MTLCEMGHITMNCLMNALKPTIVRIHARLLLLTAALSIFSCAAAFAYSDSSSVFSQRSAIWWSFVGSAGVNLHSSSILGLPSVEYTSPVPFSQRNVVADIGWNVGLEASLPLATLFRGVLRADYQTWSGVLGSDESIVVSTLLPNGTIRVPRQATLRHTVTTSLGSIGFTPMVRMTLFNALSASVGLRLGLLLRSPTEQTTEIIVPGQPNATFIANGSNTRVDTSLAAIPSANALQTAFVGSLSYTVPLAGGAFFLSPELSFQQGLSNLATFANSASWKVTTFRAGLMLTFAGSPAPAPILPTNTPDNITARRSDAESTQASVHNLFEPIRIDTLTKRDTTMQLVAWNDQAQTRLLQRSEARDVHLTGEGDVQVLLISESYVRDIPKPKPILLPSVDIRFLTLNADKKLVESNQAQKLNIETVVVRQLTALSATAFSATTNNGKLFTDDRDTLNIVNPPVVRFYPKIISEAGVRSCSIEVAQNLDRMSPTAFTPSALAERRVIAQIPCNTGKITLNGASFVEWNAEQQSYFPEHFILANTKKEAARGKLLVELNVTMMVVDDEGQHAVLDSAQILLEHTGFERSSTGVNRSASANTSTEANVDELRQPSRSLMIGVLTIPTIPLSNSTDGADSTATAAVNHRILDEFRLELRTLATLSAQSAAKGLAGRSWKLMLMIPPFSIPNHKDSTITNSSSTNEDVRIRLYVDEITRYLGIPSEKVIYTHDGAGAEKNVGAVIVSRYKDLDATSQRQLQTPLLSALTTNLKTVRIILERKLPKP